MRVSVVGTGYVGLVSGVCLAAKGHDVTCLDVRSDVVNRLSRGEPHIHENGLPALLKDVVARQRFRATLASADALRDSDIIIVAVGTPSVGGRTDFTQLQSVCRLVGEYVRDAGRFVSVVVKSTVLPGTTDTLVKHWIEEASGRTFGSFGLGMNPEFLREGVAIGDFMDPDRIVLGFEDEQTLGSLRELYAPWSCEKVEVNTRTAEMIKYAANCLLATQISAVNELANIAAVSRGIDIYEVMKGVHLDRRWKPRLADGTRVTPGIVSYLWPGCGFGGSCFPKDLQALRSHAESLGVSPRLLNAVLDINDQQPLEVVRLLEHGLDGLEGKSVLILGLAFKPGTDDVRESPALKVVETLVAAQARVQLHDPVASGTFAIAMPSARSLMVQDWRQQVGAVDAVALLTAWDEYGSLAEREMIAKLQGRVFLDARRRFAPAAFPGVRYLSIGCLPLS